MTKLLAQQVKTETPKHYTFLDNLTNCTGSRNHIFKVELIKFSTDCIMTD